MDVDRGFYCMVVFCLIFSVILIFKMFVMLCIVFNLIVLVYKEK